MEWLEEDFVAWTKAKVKIGRCMHWRDLGQVEQCLKMELGEDLDLEG